MHWADRKRLGNLPPPESVLANWPEPGEHDQHAFTDIVDAKAIAHYRSTLLSSLSQILQEVDAKQLAPRPIVHKNVQGEIIPVSQAAKAPPTAPGTQPAMRDGDAAFEFNTR